MKDNLDIEKLFKDKFESFDPAVNAQVWQNIATSVTAKAGAASAVSSTVLWVKGLLIGAVAATVGIGTWFYFDKDTSASEPMVVNQADSNDPTIEVVDTKTENIVLESNVSKKGLMTETVEKKNADVPVKKMTGSDKKDLIQSSSTVSKPNVSDSKKNIAVYQLDKQQANDNNSAEIAQNSGSDKPVMQTIGNENHPADNVVEKAPISEPVTEVNTETGNYSEDELPVGEAATEKSSFEEIPNVFTPDNDRKNDQFFIACKNIDEFYIVIYTRYNVKLYESTNPSFKWDGYSMTGNKVPDGTYYYLIKAVGIDGEAHSIAGQINIR